MFTLRTLFVHRRAFARHLFSRADFSPVRVSRLHAVMEPKIRRSCDEFAFTVSERCVSTLASRVSFRQSIGSLALKKRSRKKAAGGWQLCAYVYPTVDARAVPSPRMDAMRKKLKHVVVAAAAAAVVKTTRIVVAVGNRSFVRSFNDAPSSSEHSLPHPPHETVVDCVSSVNRVPHRAQNPFPFPILVSIDFDFDDSSSSSRYEVDRVFSLRRAPSLQPNRR